MKKFLKQGTIFVAIPIIYLSINYFINQYFINYQKIELNTNVLIVGNSHNKCSINPIYFYDAKNISQRAEPYIITFLKLKEICKNSRIDTLILNFSYSDISGFNDKKFIDKNWSGEMFERIYSITKLNDFKQLDKDVLYYYYIKIKKLCLFPKSKHGNFIGSFKAKDNNKFHDGKTEAIKRHFFYDSINAGISSVSITYLDSIINLTNKNNMELILVVPPLYQPYADEIPVNIKSEFIEIKDSLENINITIIDLSKSITKKEYFFNSDHLNERGAEKYTKILIDKIKSSN